MTPLRYSLNLAVWTLMVLHPILPVQSGLDWIFPALTNHLNVFRYSSCSHKPPPSTGGGERPSELPIQAPAIQNRQMPFATPPRVRVHSSLSRHLRFPPAPGRNGEKNAGGKHSRHNIFPPLCLPNLSRKVVGRGLRPWRHPSPMAPAPPLPPSAEIPSR